MVVSITLQTYFLATPPYLGICIPVHEDGLYDLEAGVVEERRGETHGQQQRKPRQHEGLQQIGTFVIMSDIQTIVIQSQNF